jgi:DNA-binding NarL/FixJ family response regulator
MTDDLKDRFGEGDQFVGHTQESYDRAAQTRPSRKRKTRKCSTGSAGLTARGRQVATLVRRGLSNREIAEKLGVTEGTIKLHVHAIHEKLKIHSRTKLVIALMKRSQSRRLKI